MAADEVQVSRAFARRDFHRRALNAHMLALLVGLLAAFGVNRFVTPDVFWAHYVAAAWGVLFLGHLAVFSRATLQTMGGAKKTGTGGAQRLS